jgi:hypothetical protein
MCCLRAQNEIENMHNFKTNILETGIFLFHYLNHFHRYSDKCREFHTLKPVPTDGPYLISDKKGKVLNETNEACACYGKHSHG